MNVFQIMRNMSTSQRQADHLVLRNGQIVNATLLDMFDNGDAKLNIQGFNVRAQLEAPMVKGEHTFMQVESFKDGLVSMKLISNERHTSSVIPDSNIQQMLKNTNMPNNTAWRQIVQEMLQRNIPLLPETMTRGVELLGKNPSSEMANSWMNMLERNIPASQATLTAVHQVNTGPAINQLIANLQEAVNNQLQALNSNSEALAKQGPSQETNLLRGQGSQDNLLSQVIGGQKQAQVGEGQVKSNQPEHQAKADVNLKAESSLTQQAKEAASQPVRDTMISSQREVQESLLRLSNLIKNLEHEGQKATRNPLVENKTTNSSVVRQDINLAQESTSKEVAKEANQASDRLVKTDTVEQTSQAISRMGQETSKAESNSILNLLKSMGLNHEKDSLQFIQRLLTSGAELEKSQESPLDKNLKAELLNIINNKNIPPAIREMSSQVLNNITGQQLLSTSHDSQNIFHNVMVQIPISWGEEGQDTLNLQIQGKKGKKSIDPNNCSIYLEVEPPSLGELGIYVNIVNKVVSVRLFSEHKALQNLIDLTFSLLSSGLDEQGYKLSYIKLEDGRDKGQKDAKEVSTYKKLPSQGFDVRV